MSLSPIDLLAAAVAVLAVWLCGVTRVRAQLWGLALQTALLAGVLFGMIVALPIGGLVGWAVKGARSIEHAPSAQPMVILAQPPLPAAPYMTTSVNPAWHGGAYPVAASAPQLQPRKYTIGGEEVISHESSAVW